MVEPEKGGCGDPQLTAMGSEVQAAWGLRPSGALPLRGPAGGDGAEGEVPVPAPVRCARLPLLIRSLRFQKWLLFFPLKDATCVYIECVYSFFFFYGEVSTL